MTFKRDHAKQQKSANPKPHLEEVAEIQAAQPDSLCLFRVGDFFEVYGNDAVDCKMISGLTITTQNPGATNQLQMAGFPYHQLETHVNRLKSAGKRLAICETDWAKTQRESMEKKS